MDALLYTSDTVDVEVLDDGSLRVAVLHPNRSIGERVVTPMTAPALYASIDARDERALEAECRALVDIHSDPDEANEEIRKNTNPSLN